MPKPSQEEELLISWVAWSVSWMQPAEVVKTTAWPSKGSLSDAHNFEVLALKSQIITEQVGFKSLILNKNKSRL